MIGQKTTMLTIYYSGALNITTENNILISLSGEENEINLAKLIGSYKKEFQSKSKV